MGKISVVEMLEQEIPHEEILDRNERGLARLTFYKLPVDWYMFMNSLDVEQNDLELEEQRKRYQLYMILFMRWERGIWGNDYPRWDVEELNRAIDTPFATGEQRKFFAKGARRGASWTGIREINAEILYRSFACTVCANTGLDYSIDAIAEGVPLEHVFPEEMAEDWIQ